MARQWTCQKPKKWQPWLWATTASAVNQLPDRAALPDTLPGPPDAEAATRPWLVPTGPPPRWPAATRRENPHAKPSAPASREACSPSRRRRLPPRSSPLPEAPSSLPPSRSLPRHPRRGRARPGGRGPPPSLARRPPAQRQAPPAAAAATRELPHRRGHVCSGGTNNTQTCCAGFPGPYRPAVPPAPPQRRRGRGAPQPAARYPVSPPAACRGEAAPAREAGRGRAALPQGRATAAPRQGRQPATAPTPPPGEQSAAEPQGLRRARGRRADPSAGLGRGKSPSGRGYSPGCGAAGARGWEEAGGRAGGRGAEPGPARSGRAVAAAAAALSRLVPPRWPGGGSPGTGTGGAAPTPPPSARRRRAPDAAAPASAPPPSLQQPAPRPRGAEPRYRPPLPRSRRGSCAGPGPTERRRREAPPRRETMRRRRPARGLPSAAPRRPRASAPPRPPVRSRGAIASAPRSAGRLRGSRRRRARRGGSSRAPLFGGARAWVRAERKPLGSQAKTGGAEGASGRCRLPPAALCHPCFSTRSPSACFVSPDRLPRLLDEHPETLVTPRLKSCKQTCGKKCCEESPPGHLSGFQSNCPRSSCCQA